MFPCCSKVYDKYITKDGLVDEKRYVDLQVKYGEEIIYNEIIWRCTCDCHKDGEEVIH